MPLTTTVQTVTEFRDTCAQLLGFANYAALSTLDAAQVDKAIGFAMDALAMEGNWKWLEREGAFTTTAGYTTGTVTVTNGSATVTGSGTSWNTSSNVLADDKFNAGEAGFYRIASVDSDTQITLATAFAGTTAAGATYEIRRDEYDLVDGVLELLTIRIADQAERLINLSPHEWEEITEGDWDEGEPNYAMLIGSDASEAGNTGTNQRLQLYPLPDDEFAIVYTYRSLATLSGTGTDNMEFGPQASSLLVYRAMMDIYRQRQEPERLQEYSDAFAQQLLLVKRTEMSRSRRVRHFMKDQWDNNGRIVWPRGWPDVTSQ